MLPQLPPDARPETLSLDAGLTLNPATRSIQPDISMSVNHLVAPGEGAFSAAGLGDIADEPYTYARWLNPTVRALETRMAALEGAGDALAFATGVAAIAGVFLTLLKAGDHLIISDVTYAGAAELARVILPGLGIEVTPVNLSRPEDLRAALRSNTRLVHCESPCNPILRLTDLAEIARIAHGAGALVSVDSTLATPVSTRPLALGVDLVIHSLTKFINGHGDALGGIVCGPQALIAQLRGCAGVYLGASLSASNAWLILRGIDTLFPRMVQINQTAATLAQMLEDHPAVERVIWPGLRSHPQHDLAQRQMDHPGGVIGFCTKDGPAMARQLAARLRVAHYAFSLGHQRSIVTYLDTAEMITGTYKLTGEGLEDYRRFAGDGIFRLSVGLEAAADLIRDLDQALSG
ncbi:MAG: aminotransferase class I/II-fold pyridoxal phosphate-dependent enzyme [Pseudotabrizicola sp.]|uniref:trans-sulfuration enzyme family protein n=1 Tax=Pseudotabrizicola sp. TaxID=2939647 RepID=UPI002728D86D|nr:aminotransferase class I/II-fold pyridoxal phosphate-dependent enzyme [Pseudotabrizicola sp.]MDO9641013.1 aminotransferase class I/II-fold pyridoxal phosphate-dependent enzyme [Pseudotabrizicola sp.]